MQKNLFSITVIILSVFSAAAQPVLTGANSNPVQGDKFYRVRCDPSGIYEGTTGPGVTWDFSMLTPMAIDSILYKDTTVAGRPDTFRDCSIWTGEGMGDFYYYVTDANHFALLGFIYPRAGGMLKYADPQDELYYPASYNSSHGDSVYDANRITVYADTFTYDAWGTLILPTGTFTNVARVRKKAHHYLSGALFNSPEVLYWYMPGYHDPLLTVMPGTGGAFVNSVAYSRTTRLSASVGIPGNKVLDPAGIELFPNPATGVLNINVPDGQIAEIVISNSVGTQMSAFTTSGAHMLDISSWPTGCYFVRTTCGGSVCTKQFVKM